MKTWVRLLALLLVLLSFATLIVACKKEEDPNEGGNNSTAEDGIPESLNYMGETVRILGWNAEFDEYEVDLANIGTDNVAGAIYERNLNIQDRLSVVFDIKIQQGNVTYMENFIQHVVNTYNAAPDEHYDIISGYTKTIGMLATRGYLVDMMTIEDDSNAAYLNPDNVDRHMGYIDLDRVYWPATMTETCNFSGSMYFVSGDCSTNTLYMMYAVYFNKELIDRQFNKAAQDADLETGTDLLYSYVYDGKWTIDKLIEMTTGFGADTNNNNKQDNKDRIGLATGTLHAEALYFGANLRLVDHDTEKILKVSDDYGSLKTTKLVGKLGKWLTTKDVYIDAYNKWYNDASLSYENAFYNRQTMFLLMRAYVGQKIIDNAPGLKFGVLPVPKYDEKQVNYYTDIGNPLSLYGISANFQVRNNDKKSTLQMLSAVIECWGSEGYALTTPQIFNVNMLSKWAEGEDEVAMFQYVRTSIIYDLGKIFGSDLSVMQQKPLIAATFGNSWSQTYQAYIGTIEAQLAELVRGFGF
ncbi:MAG: hypothetical protein IJA78_01530 [Clostridia bacterium]|nr:hypothetical protein [Clostridia bacterium]